MTQVIINTGCLPWLHDWKILRVKNPLPYSGEWMAGARTMVAVKCAVCSTVSTFALRQKYTRAELLLRSNWHGVSKRDAKHETK